MVVRMDDPKFGDCYRWVCDKEGPNVVVMVIGHTGFRGAWHCLNVRYIGEPSLFEPTHAWSLTNGNWRKMEDDETWD